MYNYSYVRRYCTWKHYIWKPVDITRFEGIDTTKVDGSKNPVLKRHMEDYQFIQAFREKGWLHRWIAYPIWKATSDCGRSLLIWAMWSLGLAGFFGFILYGIHEKNLQYDPNIPLWRDHPLVVSLYFSIVTFTTLGFGDITAKTLLGAVVIGVEVVIGYIMLGGLISIFANKLARRA